MQTRSSFSFRYVIQYKKYNISYSYATLQFCFISDVSKCSTGDIQWSFDWFSYWVQSDSLLVLAPSYYFSYCAFDGLSTYQRIMPGFISPFLTVSKPARRRRGLMFLEVSSIQKKILMFITNTFLFDWHLYYGMYRLETKPRQQSRCESTRKKMFFLKKNIIKRRLH